MQKYLIQRDIPGAHKLSPEELQGIAARSCKVIADLNHEGRDIQWIHSFISEDRITCVYIAPDEQTLRDHAMRGEFPADAIRPVTTMIDPLTSQKQ